MIIKLILETYLESSHVSWIAGILKTILIAFQEEFQEKSEIKWNEKELVRILGKQEEQSNSKRAGRKTKDNEKIRDKKIRCFSSYTQHS